MIFEKKKKKKVKFSSEGGKYKKSMKMLKNIFYG